MSNVLDSVTLGTKWPQNVPDVPCIVTLGTLGVNRRGNYNTVSTVVALRGRSSRWSADESSESEDGANVICICL